MNWSEAPQYFKYIYSSLLLLFCVTLVMSCIFTSESSASEYNVSPIFAFFLFWFLISWLVTMEGGQGCLVGLRSTDSKKFSDTHPITLKCTQLAHKGDNMERFIIGRQFLVVLVIFLINMCGSAVEQADPLNLPPLINTIFLENGVALMITTVDIGQLPSQVNSAVCMLDFINNYFMLFTVYVSLGIEFSGLLHSVYLVQYAFASFNGAPIRSNEPPRTMMQKIFFATRVLISITILIFALAVTIQALLEGKSGMWEGVSVTASMFIFFSLLCLVGIMEGMQIAAFALLNKSEDELSIHKIAHANCQLMFDESNLQSFLIGRQIFVAALMFIVAKITDISIDKENGETNIFNMSDGAQKFFDTGLLGSVILTIIGSLAWRIIASSFPLAFMSNPAIYIIIRVCFIIDATGVCSAAWILALIHQSFGSFKPDDFYIEEEKSAAFSVEDARNLYASSKATSRRSVIFSSIKLKAKKEDSLESSMSKMRQSFVAANRYSGVISIDDFEKLHQELKEDKFNIAETETDCYIMYEQGKDRQLD